jgi:hypothetical protein
MKESEASPVDATQDEHLFKWLVNQTASLSEPEIVE